MNEYHSSLPLSDRLARPPLPPRNEQQQVPGLQGKEDRTNTIPNQMPADDSNHPDTASIIKKAQQGDTVSLQELLGPYESPIFHFILRMLGNRQDAEDATQETFYKIIKALPRYHDQGQFKAWVYQIARNEALGSIRKRKKHHPTEEKIAEDSQDIEAPASLSLERKEQCELLQQNIQQLPAPEREVVTLRLQRDITFREIADITNTSLNTVLGRMRNATLRLRKLMTPQIHEY